MMRHVLSGMGGEFANNVQTSTATSSVSAMLSFYIL